MSWERSVTHVSGMDTPQVAVLSVGFKTVSAGKRLPFPAKLQFPSDCHSANAAERRSL